MNPLVWLAAAGGLGFSLRFTWWRPRRRGVPILMYHQVAPHRPGSPLNKWRVQPSRFARHLAFLSNSGYRGVSLRAYLDEPEAPDRRVVLTFDDGFAALVSNALPLLQEHGFGATVFVVAGKLGGTNDWDGERPGDPLLDRDGLATLAAAGIEIGSHGTNHRALAGADDETFAEEIVGSRRLLEEATGAPVVSFCYPYGSFDDRAVAAVRQAGYRAAAVIRGGILPDLSEPFRLERIAVRGTDTLLDFRLALTRGRSRL